jgi:Flp pilus assembly protein TadG
MPPNEDDFIRPLRRGVHLTRLQRGQSLIETLVGFMVLIPLGLFSFDLTVLLMANQNNRQLAENAARAAANQPNSLQAIEAATGALKGARKASAIKNATILDVTYSPGTGQVSVTTEVDVQLPVSFPGMKTVNLRANAVQPIVAIPAPI